MRSYSVFYVRQSAAANVSLLEYSYHYTVKNTYTFLGALCMCHEYQAPLGVFSHTSYHALKGASNTPSSAVVTPQLV